MRTSGALRRTRGSGDVDPGGGRIAIVASRAVKRMYQPGIVLMMKLAWWRRLCHGQLPSTYRSAAVTVLAAPLVATRRTYRAACTGKSASFMEALPAQLPLVTSV